MTQENSIFTKIEPQVEDQSQQGSYLEQLVGDDKKFKDAEALAKGKAESDRMIAELLAEKRELEQKAAAGATVEDLMAKLEARQAQSASTQEPQASTESVDQGQSQELSEEKVAQLLDNKFNEFVSQTQKENNLKQVEAALNSVYGNDSTLMLNQKSRELNIELTELQDIAAKNPKMFLTLVGVNEPQTKVSSATATPVDTNKVITPNSNSSDKNYQFYEKMRKEDSSRYFSPEVQKEMFANAERQGAKFFE